MILSMTSLLQVGDSEAEKEGYWSVTGHHTHLYSYHEKSQYHINSMAKMVELC